MIPKPRPSDLLREADAVWREWRAPDRNDEIGIDYSRGGCIWLLIALSVLFGIASTLAGVAVLGLR